MTPFEVFFLIVFLACALIFSYAVIWSVIEIKNIKDPETNIKEIEEHVSIHPNDEDLLLYLAKLKHEFRKVEK